MKMNEKNEWYEYWPQIADTMDGGLALIGPDGRVVLVNRAFEHISGYSRDELLGQTCEVFHCDSCSGVRDHSPEYWCQLFQWPDGKIESCRCEMIRKDGQVIPVLKNASVLRNENGKVLGAVETVVDISDLVERDRKIDELSKRLHGSTPFFGMDGQTAVMRKTFSLIEKAAISDFPVILYGESGTGKELAAQAIHRLSQRRDGPFVSVNCASLSESLLESEFFGHVKGAFTGAYRHRKGRFEAAHGGSFFLDEIGEMPLSTQVKLLRVLETNRVERVGDHRPIRVDARLIAATNRNLPDMVNMQEFREDLFFRINVIPIRLPPLRERMDDLPLLVGAIIRELVKKTGKKISGLSRKTMDLFMDYPWTGNIRELKSTLQYAFVVAESALIEPEDLPNHILDPAPKIPRGRLHDKGEGPVPEEKIELIEALKKAGGNKSETARILGVTRATVWNRIRKYNVKVALTVSD